jgi:hypothetical protein
VGVGVCGSETLWLAEDLRDRGGAGTGLVENGTDTVGSKADVEEGNKRDEACDDIEGGWWCVEVDVGVKEGPIDTSYSPSEPPWWKWMISAESLGDEAPASGLRRKGNGAEANASAGEMVLYGVGAEGARYDDVEMEVDVDVEVEVEVDWDAVEKKDSTPAPAAPAREGDAGGGRRGVVGSCDSGGIGVVSDGG